MAYWTFKVYHIPTDKQFSAAHFYFNEDTENVCDLMHEQREAFVDFQENNKTFMFKSAAGYASIPPNILKDCFFITFMCDPHGNPIEFDH